MPESTEFRRRDREELRGLFTLGLMAILITLRISQTEIVLVVFDKRFIITGILDLTLALWGAYAFLIIVSLSGDILPERFCEVCYKIGVSFLVVSFLMYWITAIAISTNLPVYWNVVVSLVLLSPGYYVIIASVIGLYRRIRKYVLGKKR